MGLNEGSGDGEIIPISPKRNHSCPYKREKEKDLSIEEKSM